MNGWWSGPSPGCAIKYDRPPLQPSWLYQEHFPSFSIAAFDRLLLDQPMMATVFRVLFLVVVLVRAAASADLEKLDVYLRKAREDWNVPGFAIAIVHEDNVVFARGYGVRELSRTEPVDEHTLFAIASNTKAFTAAALAMLVREKKINWDDRVRDRLEYFEIFDDPWISKETRIDDLLCHRIGFRTFSGDLIWWNTPYTAEEVIRRARFLKPSFGFRRGYGYSNLMFLAAGEVVAKVSGRSWVEFVRSEILQPLNMTNTVLSVPELKMRENIATPHGDEEGRPFPIAWQDWHNVLAAGGIISSVSDLAQWLRLQLNTGTANGRTFYSSGDAWKMWSIHNPIPQTAEERRKYPETTLAGAALGWFVSDYRGTLLARHGGGYDGMFSHTIMAPRKKVGIVVLSNSMTPLPRAAVYYALDAFLGGNERDWSAEALKEDREKRAKEKKEEEEKKAKHLSSTSPSLPLEKYAGTFGGPMYGDATVSWENGKLMLRLLPNPELTAELVHWQHDVFEVRWMKKHAWFRGGKVQFFLNQESEVADFKMDIPNEDFWFDELEFKRRPSK
jgi:CubicO group peptidase (beta-lactamase class C family)